MLLACERDVSIIRIYPGHFSWETITTPLKLRITAASAPLPVPYPATGRHKDMWKGEGGGGRGVFDEISGERGRTRMCRIIFRVDYPLEQSIQGKLEEKSHPGSLKLLLDEESLMSE